MTARMLLLAIVALLAIGGVTSAIADLGGTDDASGVELRKDDSLGEVELVDDDDEGDGDDTRGNDGTGGGDNTGDRDNTRGDDGTNGGDNTGDGDNTGGNDGTDGGDNTRVATPPAPAPAPAAAAPPAPAPVQAPPAVHDYSDDGGSFSADSG